ncbi:phosphoenolpyruvate mutase [Solwaraspora sp. WMMD1047]|uniref:phosphoenolpyruvate mutase n=1 Tax=Solwaraspora sp. WMMD1047 TaxID=3016102 RepID=UPI002416311F|nr:phosphoenolpyruvate mutase [Solwaraspora sp. WMMD1047]MDG4834264.1 phosphoenolpyruvate mutase [Solwaraspora sp. WMMD1047]
MSYSEIGGGASPSAGVRLRRLLTYGASTQLMGVHDGMSTRIASAEGFAALWASGLCMSTALGVRDSDEASWNQLVALVGTMTQASDRPILVDGDTGYGNFNTARRFVRAADGVGAAGVCLEDKVFPKMNSFFGDGHRLAPVSEFCGKLMACRDGLDDPGFMLVARTETLIAGGTVAEALDRAAAYVEAGADAIFIHSRKPDVGEIADFCRQWGDVRPVIIAPTTYHRTDMSAFQELGIAGVIWANHGMRAAYAAIRDTCRTVLAAESVSGVEDRIAPLKEIFSLYRYEDLEQEEQRYTHWEPRGSRDAGAPVR